MVNIIWCSFIILGILFCLITNKLDIINTEILNSTKTSLDMIVKIFPVMALWLGIMNIAKESGLLNKISKKFDIVKQRTIEINQLEEKADRIFEKAMKRLYSTEKDSLEVIRWTEMFRCLEDAVDSCEHLADSIEDVIMKNS